MRENLWRLANFVRFWGWLASMSYSFSTSRTEIWLFMGISGASSIIDVSVADGVILLECILFACESGVGTRGLRCDGRTKGLGFTLFFYQTRLDNCY